jgi:hypothetical protein
MPLIKYRTTLVVILGYIALFAGLALCLRNPLIGGTLFIPFAAGIGGLAVTQAGKSSLEHHANKALTSNNGSPS